MPKRRYYILILILIIAILLTSGTYAYWKWSSETEALVSGKVCVPEIIFVGGKTINGKDLLPSRSKEEGLKKDITVNLSDECDNATAVLNLNLVLSSFPSGLADSSFKWELYKVSTEEINNQTNESLTYINGGNFANKSEDTNGDNPISLATDLIVTEDISTYRLFIWIDGNMDNPSTMGGNLFRFNLYGDGRDAIYNEYTMKRVYSNYSASASFWGSPIKANQVKSIRFVKKSEVPDNYAGSLDVSSVANSGNIMMYYVENGSLYDVYIASNSGLIKANTNADNMFAYLTKLEYVDLEGLDTSEVTNMSGMFYNCSKLTSIDVSNFDTSKVTAISSMFASCSSLTTLDLSNFNTSNVINMRNMFSDCSSLTSLDVSSFDTSNVTNMMYMFSNCSSLTSIDVSNFDTSNVTSMNHMFFGCSSLTSLDLSNFDTSNVTDMMYMFFICRSLTSIDVSNFDTSNVTNMGYMFSNCSSLTSRDVSNFNTLKVTSMYNMF